MTSDVNLPKDHEPVFPSRCVRCGEDPLGEQIKLTTQSVSWLGVLFLGGKFFSIQVPACMPCGYRIRFQRIGSWVATLVLVTVCLVLLWPLVSKLVPLAFRRWFIAIFAMICILPQIVWEIVFPPAFDFTAFKKSVDYEFRDVDYAAEFAALNNHAEWVKLNI